MTSVVGRVWGWVRPVVAYRPWGSGAVSDNAIMRDKQHVTEGEQSSWGLGRLSAWVWGGFLRKKSDQAVEEYWEAEEKLLPMDLKGFDERQEPEAKGASGVPRWWNRILPTSHFLWPVAPGAPAALTHRKRGGRDAGGWDSDDRDGEFSDYETPPPSPTPANATAAARQPFAFRLFARSWEGEIAPEHYEICFNFLRHLFDLFVVGFLWTVSPPAKLVLEVLGVRGALKLWLHGMAMFFVSAVGMAGLLLLVQEYLPQFALAYGVVQALVISVSVRQGSVILGEEEPRREEKGGGGEEEEDEEDGEGGEDHTEMHRTTKEGLCLG